MEGGMDGWREGGIGGWVDGWMDGWRDRWMSGWMYGSIDAASDGGCLILSPPHAGHSPLLRATFPGAQSCLSNRRCMMLGCHGSMRLPGKIQ